MVLSGKVLRKLPVAPANAGLMSRSSRLLTAERSATCSFVIIRVAGSRSVLALVPTVQTLSVSFFSLTKLAGTRFVLGTKEREISPFLPRRSGLSGVKVVGSETVPRTRTCG